MSDFEIQEGKSIEWTSKGYLEMKLIKYSLDFNQKLKKHMAVVFGFAWETEPKVQDKRPHSISHTLNVIEGLMELKNSLFLLSGSESYRSSMNTVMDFLIELKVIGDKYHSLESDIYNERKNSIKGIENTGLDKPIFLSKKDEIEKDFQFEIDKNRSEFEESLLPIAVELADSVAHFEDCFRAAIEESKVEIKDDLEEEGFEPIDEGYDDEDVFFDAFDGDQDAWDHYNQ